MLLYLTNSNIEAFLSFLSHLLRGGKSPLKKQIFNTLDFKRL